MLLLFFEYSLNPPRQGVCSSSPPGNGRQTSQSPIFSWFEGRDFFLLCVVFLNVPRCSLIYFDHRFRFMLNMHIAWMRDAGAGLSVHAGALHCCSHNPLCASPHLLKWIFAGGEKSNWHLWLKFTKVSSNLNWEVDETQPSLLLITCDNSDLAHIVLRPKE